MQSCVLGRVKFSQFRRSPESPGPQPLQDERMAPSYTLRGTVLGSHSQAQGGHEFGGTSQASEA